MSRSYKGVRAKKHRVYSGEDVQRLYFVSKNTVSNWVSVGLKPSDQSRPYMYRGKELTRFHHDRQTRSRNQLRAGEAKCMFCKCAVFPDLGTVELFINNHGALMFKGDCSECSGVAFKICSDVDKIYFDQILNPNTSGESSYEEGGQAPTCVGMSQEIESDHFGTINDRLLYQWQGYAGKWDSKTVDQHLRAIRGLETFLDQKPFANLKLADVVAFREELKRKISVNDDERLSKSTVTHIASSVRSFLRWLIKQDGYRRLPMDIPDYLELPKAFFEKALAKADKAFPTIQEAEAMLSSMASLTVMDRRDRAIFAVAFLGALRADTLVSLRLGHIIVDRRTIVQDASISRTKNGKSLEICWFPIPSDFENVVIRWQQEMKDLGFGCDDALFPSQNWLDATEHPGSSHCQPMKSKHAVTVAFARASHSFSANYTPHSAKHTIAALRDSLALTQVQRKAWSEMMGHEDEVTTDRHYGRMSEESRTEVFESICDDGAVIGATLSKEEILAEIEKALTRVIGE